MEEDNEKMVQMRPVLANHVKTYAQTSTNRTNAPRPTFKIMYAF